MQHSSRVLANKHDARRSVTPDVAPPPVCITSCGWTSSAWGQRHVGNPLLFISSWRPKTPIDSHTCGAAAM